MPQTLSRGEQECCHANQIRCGLKRGSCGGRTDFLIPTSLSQATISKNEFETDPPAPSEKFENIKMCLCEEK